MAEVYVACDGDWNAPEVQVSGSMEAMAELGKLLNTVAEPVAIEVPPSASEFYPVSIRLLILDPTQNENDRLTVSIDEKRLKLQGASTSLAKLGRSLLNFFEDHAKVGEHFHLDYYEGNEFLNETSCHLIFICDRLLEGPAR